MQRPCYICHRVIKHNEYTRHVGECILLNVNTELHPDSPGYDPNDDDYHRTPFPPHATPAQLPIHTPQEYPSSTGHAPNRASQQDTLSGLPTQSNAFQTWLDNYSPNFTKYTTIDGQKDDSGLQEFRQAAEVLRGTTREEVVKIVDGFDGFPDSDHRKTCLDLVRKALIFPGLVAYTYTHLVSCPRRASGWRGWKFNENWSDQVSELQDWVRHWSTYDDIWTILSCDIIKEKLLRILCASKVRPEEHRCNLALLDGSMVLSYDILNLAALAALCITGPRKNDILRERGAQVGKLIELFHNLLESKVHLEDRYRRHFFSVLVNLSKNSAYCPRGIYIPERTISGLESKSRGGFGIVYKGKIGSCSVAVKVLQRNSNKNLFDYRQELTKEAIIWRYLRHPNCLPLSGIYTMPGEGLNLALVSPWMDQGTLSDYLKANPKASRAKLILDVVRGLSYLHTMEPHVAHRDIKPDNVLITSKGRACLADFGLVSTFDINDGLHTAASLVGMAGTCNYMAPEMFLAEDSEKRRTVNKRGCDMYALGCTIYEVYTGRRPFERLSSPQIVAQVIRNVRPEFTAGQISPDMQSFVENLWNPESNKRLTAEMALRWMETKCRQEDVDISVPEDEWESKSEPDDKCLWSVSF